MWHEDKKHYLLSGQQLNQILAMLQMISDRNPDIEKLNEFIFSDQKKMPDEIKPVGERDSMTLEEMLAGLELRLMDRRNGKN